MCRIESGDSDYTELVDERWPVAAWAHRCMDCGRRIERDEKYLRQVWGTFWDEEENADETPETDRDRMLTEMCAQCVAAGGWLNEVCGGHMWPGVGEELSEHWAESDLYRSFGLGRLIIIGRGDWRERQPWRRNGDLVSVATVRQWVADALAEVDRRKLHRSSGRAA